MFLPAVPGPHGLRGQELVQRAYRVFSFHNNHPVREAEQEENNMLGEEGCSELINPSFVLRGGAQARRVDRLRQRTLVQGFWVSASERKGQDASRQT